VAILVVLAGLVAFGPQLNAQNPDSQPTAQQQPSAQAEPSQPMAAKAFSGKIVKEGDTLVLKDTTTNMTYQLDDQQKAKQYVGKQVKVTGSLDSSGNTIHVENIEAGS
jgi:uncharacterized protein YdeI (BOF family)